MHISLLDTFEMRHPEKVGSAQDVEPLPQVSDGANFMNDSKLSLNKYRNKCTYFNLSQFGSCPEGDIERKSGIYETSCLYL